MRHHIPFPLSAASDLQNTLVLLCALEINEAALAREEKRSRGVNSPTAHGRQGAPTKVILAHEALDSDTPGKAGP